MSKLNVRKNNNITIVGELVEWDLAEGTAQSSGKDYISGKMKVKSNIESKLGSREQVTEVEFFSMKLKKDGTPNGLYNSYVNAETLVGKRVRIDGEIAENRFFAADSSQVISHNRVEGKFIKLAGANDVDSASFNISGFIVQPVSERLDAEGNLINHEIAIAAANYHEDNAFVYRLSILDDNIATQASGVYNTADTVELVGEYVVDTEVDRVEEESAFGDKIVKEYTRSVKRFAVTSGSMPLEKGSYKMEDITRLMDAYKKSGQEIEDKAKARNNAAGGTSAGSKKIGVGALL